MAENGKKIKVNSSINFSKFRCEKDSFADYLRTQAHNDDKNNVAKVWLFVNHNKEIIGYVTLIVSQLRKRDHQTLGKLTPHNNVPGLLISEMARHVDYKGQGLGKLMLDWVVSVALDLSRYAACKLIIVESEEDKVEMYKHWGFK